MSHETTEIDEELKLGSVTYQIDGFYTKAPDKQQADDRGNTIYSDDEVSIELESVTYGDDFEITLKDQKVLDELEAELYNLI